MQTETEKRLAIRIGERESTQQLHEELLRDVGEEDLNDAQLTQAKAYRSRMVELDDEIGELTSAAEADRAALERSKAVRRAMSGAVDGTEVEEDGVVYRTMAAYARDFILTRQSPVASKIAAQFGDPEVIANALQRLELVKRVNNTLSSNVGGLTPPQHIAQIFQVINATRPLVESGQRSTLERGTLTYPKVTTRPVVAVQASEKTAAGDQGMVIDMETATASTYLGGGDLSWQAINWSTPDALDLWFRLAAADYALKTEQDAAQVLQHSAFSFNISSPIGATPTFAEFMTAIGAGYAEVFANSGRIADTIYLAPDRYGYLLGLTSAAFTQFTSVNGDNVGPLKLVVSRGMDSGVMAVGDSAGLLVAETAGAPVELRVVEPAIGGVEVGIIGAFEAVVVDEGAFSMITTAS
jgi:hypothetical protein